MRHNKKKETARKLNVLAGCQMSTQQSVMRKKETARKLNLLADYLETVPRERFYMGSWFIDNPVKSTRCLMPAHAKKHCGTKACALGWATTIKEFQKAGLSFTAEGFVTYDDSYGIFAAEKFFGATLSECENIFGFSVDLNWCASIHDVQCNLRSLADKYA